MWQLQGHQGSTVFFLAPRLHWVLPHIHVGRQREERERKMHPLPFRKISWGPLTLSVTFVLKVWSWAIHKCREAKKCSSVSIYKWDCAPEEVVNSAGHGERLATMPLLFFPPRVCTHWTKWQAELLDYLNRVFFFFFKLYRVNLEQWFSTRSNFYPWVVLWQYLETFLTVTVLEVVLTFIGWRPEMQLNIQGCTE